MQLLLLLPLPIVLLSPTAGKGKKARTKKQLLSRKGLLTNGGKMKAVGPVGRAHSPDTLPPAGPATAPCARVCRCVADCSCTRRQAAAGPT